MKKTVITLLAAAFMTAGVLGQATFDKQRHGPKHAKHSEARQKIGKAKSHKGIHEIRKKATNDLIDSLVEKGYNEDDVKVVVNVVQKGKVTVILEIDVKTPKRGNKGLRKQRKASNND